MLSFKLDLGNLLLQQILAHIDNTLPNQPASARIKLYAGAIPASPEVALGSGNTYLGMLVCSSPSGTITGKTFTFSPFTGPSSNNNYGRAEANGVATFFRISDAFGNIWLQGTITDTNGSGDMQLSTVNLYANVAINVTSLRIVVP